MAGRKHGYRFTPAQGEAYMIRYEHGNMVDSGDATIHADDERCFPVFKRS